MIQNSARRERLIRNYFTKIVAANREFIREEAGELKALAHLIGERWSTGKKWTQGEVKELKMHLINTLKIIYALTIVLLPGGLLLLPFVAGWLHRSKL